ncbi:DUF5133 domain-containing protein [Streptomyces sp. CRN 30]|uniref:DUF5133 domain-containing protein n=1 Tax=Streptomyces sp. CRN 30 TaxID=3075613 RepID=UPI002A81297B|nr:DUF5133 domain-containing protein [Streptomyces sp. CRN 30]
MLLPAKNEVARHLERYRAWERVMLAAPLDRMARGSFEDSGYTLCVLMGKRCAREAVEAAEHYLGAGPLTRPPERAGFPQEQEWGAAPLGYARAPACTRGPGFARGPGFTQGP